MAAADDLFSKVGESQKQTRKMSAESRYCLVQEELAEGDLLETYEVKNECRVLFGGLLLRDEAEGGGETLYLHKKATEARVIEAEAAQDCEEGAPLPSNVHYYRVY